MDKAEVLFTDWDHRQYSDSWFTEEAKLSQSQRVKDLGFMSKTVESKKQ